MPLNWGAKVKVNPLVFAFLELHRFNPLGVTGKNLRILDLLNHEAVTGHQSQCQLKQADSADQDGLSSTAQYFCSAVSRRRF